MMKFGFNQKWPTWIRACVFRGNLSILIDGSSTDMADKEIINSV
jgi:hypothetical protein